MFIIRRLVLQCFSPIVIVDDNESFVVAAEGDLIIAIVPPVGERLAIDHITENHHIPVVRNKASERLGFDFRKMCPAVAPT